jgi:hypothetical protein
MVLAEVDYFFRGNRRAMQRLIADIFDSATRYEYESPLPSASRGHWNSMRSVRASAWVSSPGRSRLLPGDGKSSEF